MVCFSPISFSLSLVGQVKDRLCFSRVERLRQSLSLALVELVEDWSS